MSLTGWARILQKYWRDDIKAYLGESGVLPPSGTVVTEQGWGQAASAGSAATYARGDHTHGTPPEPIGVAGASEGPGIDLIGQAVGLGGDTILLFNSGGQPVAEYAATSAGLDAASAAAVAGNVIHLPAMAISGDHTLTAGVHYVGLGRKATILTGQITGVDGAVLDHLSVTRAANDATTLVALLGPASGTMYALDCDLVANQAGAGTGYAVCEQAGTVVCRYCVISAQSGGVDSNPFSAARLIETSLTAGVKVLDLWNGASNDAPPADWETTAFDDSAWNAAVEADEPVTEYATPLWCSVSPASNTQECLLRHKFTLGAVTTARLRCAYNNGIILYVNGNELLNDVPGDNLSSTHSAWIDVTTYLVSGINVIAAHGNNNRGPYAWDLWEMEITAPLGIQVYACEIVNATGATTPEPVRGDRSVYDVDNYATLHASDIQAGVMTRHLPAATGAEVGQVPTVQSDGTYGLETPASGESEATGIYVMSAFYEDGSGATYLFVSGDGKDWRMMGSGPVFAPSSADGKMRDPSIVSYGGRYWLCGTWDDDMHFPVAVSDDLLSWAYHTSVDMSGIAGITRVWAPEWFVDDDGSLHVFVSVIAGGHHLIYESHPTNADLTAWSAPVQVTGTALPEMIDPFVLKIGSTYYLWYKHWTGYKATAHIEYATSNSLTSGFIIQGDDDFAGWGYGYEGESLVEIRPGVWRIYLDDYVGIGTPGNGIYYSESSDGFATWSALQLATFSDGRIYNHPTVALWQGREELAALRAYLQATLDHGGLVGLADDDHTQYLNTARHDTPIRHTLGSVVEHDNLTGLTDVTISGVSEGEVLTYVSGQWRNREAVGGTGELMVQDGSSAPPVTLTNEAEDDWLYADP